MAQNQLNKLPPQLGKCHRLRLAPCITTAAATVLVGTIRVYQIALSPWMGRQCRFYPTCSHYALEAIDLHGPWRGGWLALKRLARCHPFNEGGVDPVRHVHHSN